jgi:DNA-binding LacI/PurR family transcriptional regulator
MVSISDVASEAGVSPTTVSHALSGKRRVSPGVKTRVEAAMKRLAYSPSRTAQNLARGRTQLLAIVIPDIGNSYFAELAKGVEAAAGERGYNVILCTTGFDHEREIQYLQMIKSRAVDGIVYAAGAPPTNRELSAVLGEMPLVFVDEAIEGTKFCSVISDNEDGGRLVAEHLLALGHRHALVIAFNGDTTTGARRVRGFRDAWLAGGGSEPEIIRSDYTEGGGRAAIMPHVSAIRRGDITAVFALNDLMALGVINQLRTLDLAVPARVSVVGFDDMAVAQFSNPQLTTIRQNVRELGVNATATLIDFLDKREALTGEQVMLPVELIVRESTAPPREPRRLAS